MITADLLLYVPLTEIIYVIPSHRGQCHVSGEDIDFRRGHILKRSIGQKHKGGFIKLMCRANTLGRNRDTVKIIK